MAYWFHAVVHWLGWNTGKVVSAYDKSQNLWIGFQCRRCGKVSGAHITKRGAE